MDGGAAGGVGQIHLVAEELGDQLDIRGLAAAGAGAGELEQGLANWLPLRVFLPMRSFFAGRVCIVPRFSA